MRYLALLLMSINLLIPAAMAQYREFTRPASQRGLLARLLPQDRIHAYFFDSSTHQLQVLDEGYPRRYGSLKRALAEHHCTAGVNGGYFSADSAATPLGLVAHRGRIQYPLASGSFTVSGVLYDTGKGIFLERSHSPSHQTTQMREGIQGGPFLIERGGVVKGLNDKREAMRTFVATDGRGRWCIAVSSSMTLRSLALWLKQGALGRFPVYMALNLDGGSSSTFFDLSSGQYIAGAKPVRNYLGIKPRGTYRQKR